MFDHSEGEGPLSSTDLERDRERSGQTTLRPEDAEGHTLPASEADQATSKEPDEARNPSPGAIPPPD